MELLIFQIEKKIIFVLLHAGKGALSEYWGLILFVSMHIMK